MQYSLLAEVPHCENKIRGTRKTSVDLDAVSITHALPFPLTTSRILVPRARRFLVKWSGRLQIKPSGSRDENVTRIVVDKLKFTGGETYRVI